ncbi:MAG: glucose-6-phosphate isomerase [Gammaproteobacteria bacterium]|nr:glucose-6-phosphate isomerase [Gammaproteobacteria bacterium]
MALLTESSAWKSLQSHYASLADVHMRDLFAHDPLRFSRFSLQFEDFLLDFSKNRVTGETLRLLRALARERDVPGWIQRMFNGEKINHTENRAVLHVALRHQDDRPLPNATEDIMPGVRDMLRKMRQCSEAIRSRRWLGHQGQAITDIVNIGVGGSDLGPLMATRALRPYAAQDLRVHFVSNVDARHIMGTLENLNPNTTLFIIVSKSFTTHDTLLNAQTARRWFLKRVDSEQALQRHFLAVTSNNDAATDFGVAVENIFSMWDWVGGRYSMWSAVGLSIAIAIGMEGFEQMLAGAYALDEHFRSAPLEMNLPVTLALLGIWYNNFFDAQSYAVLPYVQELEYLPEYLRQMDMESNGKRIDRDGQVVDYTTGPIVFGQLGITGQHAFYQLLHQGTKLIPADFIAPLSSSNEIKAHHQALMANVFAQTEALMKGKTEAEARLELHNQGWRGESLEMLLPHKVFPGNKPTNTLLFNQLDPRSLGILIALYEHKVFVQGLIWGINSFDQWGVELGKQLVKYILAEIGGDSTVVSHDASTNGLINYYRETRAAREAKK